MQEPEATPDHQKRVSEATTEAQKQKQKTYSLLNEDMLSFYTCVEATGVRATEAT